MPVPQEPLNLIPKHREKRSPFCATQEMHIYAQWLQMKPPYRLKAGMERLLSLNHELLDHRRIGIKEHQSASQHNS
jgi:hypothetical protein